MRFLFPSTARILSAGLVLALLASALPARAAEPTPDVVKVKIKAASDARDVIYKEKGERAALIFFNAEVEKLIVEYPTRPEPIEGLLEIAYESPDAEAKTLFGRVAAAPVATDRMRASAQSQLARLGRIGKPLELKFTSTDGRTFDLAALRSKVVVIDFWATWCGPCMQDLPGFKEVMNRFKDRGVEIVGISLDKDRAKLDAVVARENMFWPQYFDGLGWKNEMAVKFGIQSIPALWLVDKQGVLRDTYGREDLAVKLESMLKP